MGTVWRGDSCKELLSSCKGGEGTAESYVSRAVVSVFIIVVADGMVETCHRFQIQGYEELGAAPHTGLVVANTADDYYRRRYPFYVEREENQGTGPSGEMARRFVVVVCRLVKTYAFLAVYAKGAQQERDRVKSGCSFRRYVVVIVLFGVTERQNDRAPGPSGGGGDNRRFVIVVVDDKGATGLLYMSLFMMSKRTSPTQDMIEEEYLNHKLPSLVFFLMCLNKKTPGSIEPGSDFLAFVIPEESRHRAMVEGSKAGG
ncbi:hypothetical protein GGS20DRAFT_584722 [Poronia punctata]|nr:hypothetical protein GGS20DRAFT_584722 [Poronia punctata]